MDGEVGKELGGREGDIKKGHEETLRSAVFIMLIDPACHMVQWKKIVFTFSASLVFSFIYNTPYLVLPFDLLCPFSILSS